MSSRSDARRRAGPAVPSGLALASALICAAASAGIMGRAHATGDARSLTLFHTHTKERATITFWRDGRFDADGLKQLNWFLRDWRVEEPAKMDPQLFHVLWEVNREAGGQEPIHIVSAYRSPRTNAMLRSRSKGVSEHSQHMLGKAMDIRLPDVDTGRLRAIAMKMQYGGVGYYPSSAFVHVDTGSVRAWPRMSQEQLARLFPDGKTVHLPANGKPLARYEEAKAEVQVRKQALASATGGGNPFTGLVAFFRGGQPGGGSTPSPSPAPALAPAPAPVIVASATPDLDVVATAALTAPLPPRRPADLLLAFREQAPARLEAPPAAPAQPMRASLDGMTAASRLLFATASLSRAVAKADLRPSGGEARFLPREFLVASAAAAPSGQTFSAQWHHAQEHRFTGRAVGAPSGWRLAQGL